MKVNRNSRLGTHKGPRRAGRPATSDGPKIVAWRRQNEASIAETAEHFGVSHATVKRCCARAKDEAALRVRVRKAVYEGEAAAEASLSNMIKLQRIFS